VFTLDTEFDKVFGGLDFESLVERVELFANFWELGRVDGNNWAEVSLWDGEVFLIKRDEVHCEFSNTLGLGVLENELEVARVLLSLKGDAVGGVSEFHNFSKSGDGESEDHVGITSVLLESFHAEREGHKGNMRSIHSLEGDAYTFKLD
jgi:hypothetical protein